MEQHAASDRSLVTAAGDAGPRTDRVEVDPRTGAEGTGPWQVLLEAVIRESPIPMVLVTYPDFIIRVYNRACREMLGAEDEPEVEGRKLFEVAQSWRDLSLDDQEIPLEAMPLAKALLGQRTERAEYKVRRKDGSVRYEVVDGVPIYDGRGGLIGGFVVFPDVTDLKRAQMLLQAQYDLALRLGQSDDLREVLAICLDSVLRITGMDGGGVYLVDERTGDLDLATARGLSPAFADATRHYDAASPNAALVMAGQPIYLSGDALLDVLDAQGRSEGLRAIAALPVQHRGRVIAAVNVASRRQEEVDPASRRVLEAVASVVAGAIVRAQASEQLRRSEDRYRNFVANASEGIFRVDLRRPVPIDLPDEELARRIAAESFLAEANDALARAYGVGVEEIVGMPAVAFAPDGAARGVRLVRAPGHRLTDVETTDVDRHGREIHFSENTTAVIEDGCLVRVWGIKRDITERKRAEAQRKMLEEQLRHSQKMEAIGRLAGGIAHDFNNILTGINGFAEMAVQGLADDHPLRADLEEIRRAGERAVSLTNQLLSFSKKQVIEPKIVDLDEVIRQSERMLRRIIGEDIDLVFRPGGELGLVKADPAQIDQILVNLAANARDALPSGGSVTIETASAAQDEARGGPEESPRQGEFVVLSVIDNGRGMAPDTLERIFEPFFTTKEKGKGTGLGLATVYGIVEQHGGFIRVQSEPGKGSRFRIYLPRVHDEATRPGAPVHGDRVPGGSETILVVEDEPMVRELARRVLQRQGYRVIEAADGNQACRACRAHGGAIDLLLTDVVMPTMNGREVYERVAEIEPGLRVLFMSGYSEDLIAHHGVLDEGTHFLPKPFTVDGLARRVREVLDAPPPLRRSRLPS